MDAIKFRNLLVRIVGGSVVAIAAFYGANSYVESVVYDRLEDPEVLRKLAMRVRPGLVFDDAGSILSDSGALAYIESLEMREGDDRIEWQVLVIPKAFLALEPLVQPLDGRFVVTAERGPGISWVFQLDEINTLALESSADSPKRNRFRLELIAPQTIDSP